MQHARRDSDNISLLLPTSFSSSLSGSSNSASGGGDQFDQMPATGGALVGAGGMLVSLGSSLSATATPLALDIQQINSDRMRMFGAAGGTGGGSNSNLLNNHSTNRNSFSQHHHRIDSGPASPTWMESFAGWIGGPAGSVSQPNSPTSQITATFKRILGGGSDSNSRGGGWGNISNNNSPDSPSCENDQRSFDDISSSSSSSSASRGFLSCWRSCVVPTLWLCFALLLLTLLVGVYEFLLDSEVHTARLALLALPTDEHGDAIASGGIASNAAEYDALISMHERGVNTQKELNKKLIELQDRENKIHYLHAELANRDVLLANYKVVVARLKILKAQHHDMERQLATQQAEQMLRIQLGLLPAPPTGDNAAAAAAGGTGVAGPEAGVTPLPAASAEETAQIRARLLTLIFGNKTLEESRQELNALGIDTTQPQQQGTHAEEIAQLVREEKEAQAAASRDGFLALASRAARGDVNKDADLKMESVMRINDEGELLDSIIKSKQKNRENRLKNGEAGEPEDDEDEGPALPAAKLVDSDKNEYILSKPGQAGGGAGSKTVDVRLVQDLGLVIVASALGGLLASALKQPVILGYLAGGSAIGPGGLRLIGQFIQIETLAQFGATFLLFALGVEFSMKKLRKVKHIALLGGLLQLISITIVMLFLGRLYWNLRVISCVFIGCVLSMSSTTVVVKSLVASNQLASLSGQVMLGLLIAQDLFLSIILAFINLAKVQTLESLLTELLWLGLRFFFLGLIVCICMYIWPLLLRLLDASGSADLFLLGLVALCVFLTVISEQIIHAAEVGAFLSGLLISSSPSASPELTHRALRLFAPIRDVFGALFFSSIGMLMDPFFLLHNAPVIGGLVLVTVVVKSILTFVIVRLFGYSTEISLKTGLGLAQVGEFAFVLSSSGVSYGLINTSQYNYLAAITTVSLVLTPLLHFISRKLTGEAAPAATAPPTQGPKHVAQA
jgi:Kef-type K+ transport system membrane component KefB